MQAPRLIWRILLTTFRELGVRPETADALESVGITTPFPIQAMTLPIALGGNDVIGQAKTGTGKTLGFGIPLIQQLVAPDDPDFDQLPAAGKPQALVVVPTRELCAQVTGDLELAGARRHVRVLAVYGGRAYEPQVAALQRGVEIVVGTPGRLLDLAQQGHINLKHVRALVLDEADEMLDMGFLPDVERIVALLPATRQTMLFSATMAGPIVNLARRYMSKPTHIRAVDPEDSGATVSAVQQHVFRAHQLDKIEVLARILQAEGRGLTLVFCRTKRSAARIADDLTERGFAAGAVHGDLGQGAREQALRAFRHGKIDVLVATDVAARGIDVDDITHVVNYECPDDEKTYLHRIGRTARAGRSGTAVTLVDWSDIPRWQLINKTLDLPYDDPPETYSTSDHLFSQLQIATSVTGVLPRAQRTRAGLAAEELEDLGETGKVRSRQRAGGQGHGAAPEQAERPRRARAERGRERRRLRNGVPVGGEAQAEQATVEHAPSRPATDEHPAGDSQGPRRRRRRGGRGRRPHGGDAGAPAADTSAGD